MSVSEQVADLETLLDSMERALIARDDVIERMRELLRDALVFDISNALAAQIKQALDEP